MEFNVWIHLAITWTTSLSSTKINIYKDSVVQTTQTGYHNFDGSSTLNKTHYQLGNDASNSPMVGHISDLVMFNKELSAEEIQEIYSKGNYISFQVQPQ